MRVICETNDTPENIARKIISGVNKYYKQKGKKCTMCKNVVPYWTSQFKQSVSRVEKNWMFLLSSEVGSSP